MEEFTKEGELGEPRGLQKKGESMGRPVAVSRGTACGYEQRHMEQDFHVHKILRLWQLKMYFQSRSLNILCIARFTCEGFLLITARGVFLPRVHSLLYLCTYV